MSRAQRLTFLAIAAAIAVIAAIVLSGTGGDDEQEAAGEATATPTATATAEPQEADPAGTATPTPTPKPQPPLIGPGKVTKLRVTEGETVRFRVRADAPDEIHIHGYDRYVDVGTRPKQVSFRADLVGIWEIELHGSGEQIAQLRVDPR